MVAGSRILLVLAALILAVPVWACSQVATSELHVLSYHDVVDEADLASDLLALSVDRLVTHFDWLNARGYHVVSMDQVAEAARGGRPLPPRAVLLTFDDGLRSAYTHVFPLLRLYGYPALVAVVTGWMETGPGESIEYGDRHLPRKASLSWRELGEMLDSGLVEVASHSHDLHKGIRANPQGNLQPAAISRRFDPVHGHYESASRYQARIDADLAASVTVIRDRLGVAPRVMVWPYGAYNAVTLDRAAAHGMPFSLTLDSVHNELPGQFVIHRRLVDADTDINALERMLTPLDRRPPGRYVHVDLDYIHDPDPEVQERNLDMLVERVSAIGPSAVFLQAYADPDGDDVADAVYFPNRHLPMRADLFNRAAWQLRTRANVLVYAWMPILAFSPPPDAPPLQWVWSVQDGLPATPRQLRLSPFDPAVRKWIEELYDDLAVHARFDGILFHDDGVLSDFEDFSPAARASYRALGLPQDPDMLRNDPALTVRWTQLKRDTIDGLTTHLAHRLRRYNPELRTARNLFARTLHEPRAETWMAQSVATALQRYDLTVVMAMPALENVPEHQHMVWLRETLTLARALDPGLNRIAFELQTVDWRSGEPVDPGHLAAWINELHRLGARHLAYYPDNLHRDHPPLATIGRLMSVRSLHREAVDAR